MAGRGRDEALCRRYAEEHRLDNVKFLGFLRDGLKDLIARARFTVIPSEWYENYPLAVLESHACGTAVLGAEIGGIPELIAPGVDGLTFSSGDVGRLGERIDALSAKSTADLREMGMAGREKVARENNEDLYIERVEDVYRKVMAKTT
ncbi:MAG: glycosyltransferase [Candidatus Sumerlaeota bacterium]|nr:glycosyltransferase [Candidatus Sumerlaeota bacterium]